MWLRVTRFGRSVRWNRNLSGIASISVEAHEGLDKEKLLHHPVMVKEVLENLYPQSGDVILDLTFGAGGHTRAILDKCENCKVIALDRDPFAYKTAKDISKEYNGRLTPLLGRFSELGSLLEENRISSLNGVVLDIGCSSMQMEIANRGFSLAADGPLDMRMDGNRYHTLPTAADVVNRLCTQDLAKILEKYGEEKYSQKIARHIVHHRNLEGPIKRTRQLANVIASAFDKKNTSRRDALNRRSHVATKSFMAIRIFVNDELNELYTGLKVIENYMLTGGRLVAITFHSLEDRIVKRILSGTDINKPFGGSLFQKREEKSPSTGNIQRKWMLLKKKVVLPQFDEIDDNARSRSAKLRSATRI